MAISAYIKLGDDQQVLKNKIYNRFIHRPFNKMAEYLIHTYKTYWFDMPIEEVQASVVAFLNEKIYKFNPEKGDPFGYFSVVGKHYLFNENNANYARIKAKAEIDDIDLDRNIMGEVSRERIREAKIDFMENYIEYMDRNLESLFGNNKRDLAIADSILEIFRIRENLYSYNKKALYILIRERTNVHTQYITKVVNRMKSAYAELYEVYKEYGIIPDTYKLRG